MQFVNAGVADWLSPRLIEDIVHNRTVNLRGGPGKNVAMDRVCEFLNSEFKGLWGTYINKGHHNNIRVKYLASHIEKHKISIYVH